MPKANHLIIGASSGVAVALSNKLAQNNGENLILISRNFNDYEDELFCNAVRIKIEQYNESNIAAVCQQLNDDELSKVENVYICNGLLHSPMFQPEKQIESFNTEQFMQTMMANALSAMCWLKHLLFKLNYKPCCRIIVFSARVGSISDNQLGGWYSYRSSKAALNMLLKSVSIECKRRVKNIKIIAFHPGTTDTPLSKPFQKNVAEDKLFTTDFVAEQLLGIVNQYQADGELSYIDWQNKDITF